MWEIPNIIPEAKMANVLLNTDSIILAIEQALSGIILLQEIIINKEEYKDNVNILEALEDAYLIVAVGKYKNGNIIQSLLYCNLAKKCTLFYSNFSFNSLEYSKTSV